MTEQNFNTAWFYWTHNKYAHFIVFRKIVRDDQVASGKVTHRVSSDGTFQWQVNGPCWSTYEEKGTANTLDEAKREVNQRVNKIIDEEFVEEAVHPLG